MKWQLPNITGRKRYALLALGLIIVLFFALRPAPYTVEMATIAKSKFSQEVTEDGRTRARNVYVVTASVAGNLQRVTLLAGSRVNKGEVVAKIYPNLAVLLDKPAEQEANERVNMLTAAYNRANVLVERAKIALETATSDYQRNLVLSKSGYVSKTDLDHQHLALSLRKKEFESAKFDADAAKHEIEQAKAKLATIQSVRSGDDKNFVEVFAPIDGEVLKIERESEGPITSGARIMSIADISQLEIVADILSTDAVQVKPGDSVLIERWGGDTPLHGTVRTVEPGGFMKLSTLGVEEQRVNVVIDITSKRELWKNLGAEFRVEVSIQVFKAENVLTAPIGALFRYHDKWAVFAVKRSKARLQYVQIGRRNADAAIIKSGLTEGDEVILYPGERIANGVRVTAQK